jgi:hypothetical protein
MLVQTIMVKRALLIGINYLGTSNQLNGCINDVLNIRKVLIERYQYLPENIVVLRDDISDSTLKPTGANILLNLRQLISLSSRSSEIWVHYSGHGSTIRDTNGDEASGRDSVIVPLDYQNSGVISDDTLSTIVRSSACPSIMMFDSCNSGTICDLQWSFQCNTRKKRLTFQRTKNNQLVTSNRSIFTMSGSRDNQTSADAYDSITKSYGGAFTTALLQCMRDLQYNGNIFTLYSSTCNLLKQRGFSQVPILSSSSATPNFSITGRKGVIRLNRYRRQLPKVLSMQFHL